MSNYTTLRTNSFLRR